MDYLNDILLCFWAAVMLSVPLLIAFAWHRKDRLSIELAVVTVDVVLLYSLLSPKIKLILLGPDYSSRLFTTIEINVLVTLILAVYFGTRRRWIAGVASGLLALLWLRSCPSTPWSDTLSENCQQFGTKRLGRGSAIRAVHRRCGSVQDNARVRGRGLLLFLPSGD